MSESNISLPTSFVDRVQKDPFLGEDLLSALETSPPVSVRLHPKKHSSLSIANRIPWSTNGVWLTERPLFTLDPNFHAGAYYPQEAGSQLLDTVLRQLELPENPVFIDLCAAPGGKSTLIADFLDGKGLLVSNEIIPNRAKILHENITKWGVHNSIVTNNSSKDLEKLRGIFDCIVIDAPCSGEGMFRKDHAARNEWSESNVSICAERQKEILENCWGSLKEDGYIVYSTCTFNSNENEDNIQWFVNEFGAELIQLKVTDGFVSRNGIGYYALPNKVDTEGFYIAVLRKRTAEPIPRQKKGRKSPFTALQSEVNIGSFVILTPETKVVEWKERFWIIPTAFEEEINSVVEYMRAFKLGICVGEISRKGIIPDESLAFAPSFQASTLPRIALTKDQALHYLKGDTFQLPKGTGFTLVTYDENVLGWIKLIDNRFNNLYPKEWRIRMKID